MKKLQRNITAAADDLNEQLQDQLAVLKDDFDYIIEGLQRLGRIGANSSNDARAIAETLQTALDTCISNIADKVGEK